ncbi:MAG: 50S ribosomal protein L37ae [Candidatus Hermodarchaeota archaeon]
MRKRKRPGVSHFGARYGRSVRNKLFKIQVELRKKHPCQNCGASAVRRVSVGIWKCRKCGVTFSGGAYIPSSNLGEVAKRSIKREALS